MTNLYKYIHKKSSHVYIERYKHEFEDIRICTNVERCDKLGKVLLILNILLMFMDLLVYKPMRCETPSYLYLFYLHIIMFISIFFWFTLLKLHRNYNHFISGKIIYYVLVNVTMYWGVFLGLNDLFISGQISAYIICVFGISVCLYLTPLETFFTYSVSLIVFIIGLYFKSAY